MYWNDEGYLISKNIYNENSIIADFLTLNHGKSTGIVYGGTSRKVKNYLQIGNKIFLNYNSKNENRLGYFKTEIIKPISPLFFDDKKRTACILAASSILKLILPDEQINKKIFESYESLIEDLFKSKWIISFIYWEQLLIKELGFDFNLFKKDEFSNSEIKDNNIPKLFLNKKNIALTKKDVKEALQFNKNLILSNFFDGNNIKIPKSRLILEKYYN